MKQPKAKAKGSGEASEKGQAQAEKLINKGQALCESLEAVTPLAYWQGAVKPKDCESRIEKALQLAGNLHSQGSAECGLLADKIQAAVENMEHWMIALTFDFVNDLPTELRAMKADRVESLLGLPSDCLNAVLSDLGRRTLEARLCQIRDTRTHRHSVAEFCAFSWH